MTRGATWAVVPVKDLDRAKRRLADALDLATRRGLSLAMLSDVLDSLAGVPVLDGVALVSRDAGATDLARKRGTRVIRETGTGLNAAVAEAARVLTAEDCATMLVVPADVPLASSAEIAAILGAQGGAPAITLVPDRKGIGTNALACAPPDAISPCFGGRSFKRHLEAARDAGVPATALSLPGLGLDLDTPDDLLALSRRPGSTRTHTYLRDILELGQLRARRSMAPLAAGSRP